MLSKEKGLLALGGESLQVTSFVDTIIPSEGSPVNDITALVRGDQGFRVKIILNCVI